MKSVPWDRLGARYVILFGSAASGEKEPRDVDVAVRLSGRPRLSTVTEIIEGVARALGVDVERVDLVIIDEDIDCVLLHEILSKGILVYVRDVEDYASDIARLVKVCEDELITRRRLGLYEAQREALRRTLGATRP